MAVNAQFEAALVLKGEPEKCSEPQLRGQIKSFGEDLRKNITEEMYSDLLFLYVDFSDGEIERLFNSEKDRGYIWYDKFRWEALATGYKNAVSEIRLANRKTAP